MSICEYAAICVVRIERPCYGTTEGGAKHGGRPPQAVRDPDGNQYPSMRAAADRLGRSISWVVNRVNTVGGGWHVVS